MSQSLTLKNVLLGRISRTLLTGILCISGRALAETSSQDVFDRIQKNTENAQANKEDCKKNLGVVESNLSALVQTRRSVQDDQAKVKSELQENTQSINQIDKNISLIDKSMAQEQKLQAAEEKKIQDLEAHIAKLHAQIEKRKEALVTMANSRKDFETQKEVWKNREVEIKKVQSDVAQKDQKLGAEEKEWRSKKSKYEKDISRWDRSIEEQKKLQKNLATLRSQTHQQQQQ